MKSVKYDDATKSLSERLKRPQPRQNLTELERQFDVMPRVPVSFRDEELEYVAETFDLPAKKVLTSVDELNNEIAALSFFVSEAWTFGVENGSKQPDEFAIYSAPIFRRIRKLSSDIRDIMAGLGMNAELGEFQTWKAS